MLVCDASSTATWDTKPCSTYFSNHLSNFCPGTLQADCFDPYFKVLRYADILRGVVCVNTTTMHSGSVMPFTSWSTTSSIAIVAVLGERVCASDRFLTTTRHFEGGCSDMLSNTQSNCTISSMMYEVGYFFFWELQASTCEGGWRAGSSVVVANKGEGATPVRGQLP